MHNNILVNFPKFRLQTILRNSAYFSQYAFIPHHRFRSKFGKITPKAYCARGLNYIGDNGVLLAYDEACAILLDADREKMEGHNEPVYDPEYDPGHRSGQGEYVNRAQNAEPLPYAIPLSIIAAAVIIAGAIMFTGRNNAGTPTKQVAAVQDALGNAQDYKLLEAGAPTLGSPDAPVVIVEFADFQCPFCGRFHQTTEKEIIAQYVKTGKARLAYRDFAFLGEESNWASQAARCAGDQGKFWQYHDYLYEHQKGENQSAFNKDNLKGFALALGLDKNGFNTCLDSEKHRQAVENDTEMGRKFGVTGTPASFVNGKLVQGAVPFATFETAIKAALEGK